MQGGAPITRLSGGKGGRNALEHELRRLHVRQKNSTPNHPTTCGKVERFQQTMKKWLRAQPVQPATITDLQALIDAFTDEYNHRRPRRSLPHRATPASRDETLPKAGPKGSREDDTHNRIRTHRIDDSGTVTLRAKGRMHHIGIGEPTPEPTSPSSPRTYTSASSTPPPASSCGS